MDSVSGPFLWVAASAATQDPDSNRL